MAKVKNPISEVFRRFLLKFFLIWVSLLVSSLFFCSFFLPKDEFQKARERILKNPHNLEARLELAEIYLKNNQFKEAEEELEKLQGDKAREFQSEKLNSLWQEKRERDPDEIRKQVQDWEKLVSQYPDYRDGYLELTLLYLKLGKDKKAKETFQKALELSPNYEAAKEVEKTYFPTD